MQEESIEDRLELEQWENAIEQRDANYLMEERIPYLLCNDACSYLNTRDDDPKIHCLAERGMAKAMEIILSAADTEQKEKLINNNIRLSCINKFSPLQLACTGSSQGHVDCVKELLRLGARVNTYSWQGHTHGHNLYMTPLHFAVDAQNIDSIKLLLEAGADPNLISYDNLICYQDNLTPYAKAKMNNCDQSILQLFEQYVMPLKIKVAIQCSSSKKNEIPQDIIDLIKQVEIELPDDFYPFFQKNFFF